MIYILTSSYHDQLLFTLTGFFVTASLFAQPKYRLYIGTYTGTGSTGIYSADYNIGTKIYSLQDSIASSNPSYITISKNGKFLYGVNENNLSSGKGGALSAYKLNDKTGKMTFINKVSSEGNDPCYISIHPNKKWIVVGNYSSGNVSVYALEKDGSIGKLAAMIPHTGQGPNKDRQTSPHVHSTVFSRDGKFLFVPESGN